MTHIHSSLQPRFTPLAKTVAGRTRGDDKAARTAQERADEKACYALVDKRDGLRCRVTGRQLALTGPMVTKVERHHLKKRSQGGAHETRNVITVCRAIHDEIHVHGTRKLVGDADRRDDRGRFIGVVSSVKVHGVWTVEGIV